MNSKHSREAIAVGIIWSVFAFFGPTGRTETVAFRLAGKIEEKTDPDANFPDVTTGTTFSAYLGLDTALQDVFQGSQPMHAMYVHDPPFVGLTLSASGTVFSPDADELFSVLVTNDDSDFIEGLVVDFVSANQPAEVPEGFVGTLPVLDLLLLDSFGMTLSDTRLPTTIDATKWIGQIGFSGTASDEISRVGISGRIETATFCGPGDANCDGAVTFDDFLILASKFGEKGQWREGDFTLDGSVQFGDFLILASNFENTPNAPVLVPERVNLPAYVLGWLCIIGRARLARRNVA